MSAAWNRECPFEYVTVTLTPLEGMTMIGYFCRQDFNFIRQVVFDVSLFPTLRGLNLHLKENLSLQLSGETEQRNNKKKKDSFLSDSCPSQSLNRLIKIYIHSVPEDRPKMMTKKAFKGSITQELEICKKKIEKNWRKTHLMLAMNAMQGA